MIELRKDELFDICGGISISGTLISSLTKGITTLLDLGRSLGSAIRRIGSNKLCPVH